MTSAHLQLIQPPMEVEEPARQRFLLRWVGSNSVLTKFDIIAPCGTTCGDVTIRTKDFGAFAWGSWKGDIDLADCPNAFLPLVPHTSNKP